MARYAVCIVACLTLGLAPFVPEPHLLEKIRRVCGGAAGMRLIDWFDLVFHASPWLILLFMLAIDWSRARR